MLPALVFIQLSGMEQVQMRYLQLAAHQGFAVGRDKKMGTSHHPDLRTRSIKPSLTVSSRSAGA